MLTLYGIPNCDTCRKARKWLVAAGVAHRFHDFRVDGLERELLERWVDVVDWQALLNTRSATWRRLGKTDRVGVDRGRAVALMLANPTLIKRPVADSGDGILVGFSPESYQSLVD